MHYKGRTWYKSKTVVTLPELDGVNVQFGKICSKNTPGAVKTDWTEKVHGGPRMDIYAKKIEPQGYGRTNMMYGKDFVRNGEVRVKAYLSLGGGVYTTSWVHEEKTRQRWLNSLEEK